MVIKGHKRSVSVMEMLREEFRIEVHPKMIHNFVAKLRLSNDHYAELAKDKVMIANN